MSFHHAPLHKRSSFEHTDFSDDLPKQAADYDNESSLAEAPASDTESSFMTTTDKYDDEARFELLSAYLDGEVTVEERQLVAQWLLDDPSTQQMYRRLLLLRQAIRTVPFPSSSQTPLQVPSPPTRSLNGSLLSGLRWTLVCATATALLGGLHQVGLINTRKQLNEAWQFIKTLPQKPLLELALDKPAIELPDSSTKPLTR